MLCCSYSTLVLYVFPTICTTVTATVMTLRWWCDQEELLFLLYNSLRNIHCPKAVFFLEIWMWIWIPNKQSKGNMRKKPWDSGQLDYKSLQFTDVEELRWTMLSVESMSILQIRVLRWVFMITGAWLEYKSTVSSWNLFIQEGVLGTHCFGELNSGCLYGIIHSWSCHLIDDFEFWVL